MSTAAFRDPSAVAAAGWSAPVTGCMADASGGMGCHFGNVGLIDGSVKVDKPELLMYEPQRNGHGGPLRELEHRRYILKRTPATA